MAKNPNFQSNIFFDRATEGQEPLWMQRKEPSREGLSHTLIRAYSLTGTPHLAQIKIPANAVITTKSRPAETGDVPYIDIDVDGTHIYLYGADTVVPGSIIVVNAQVCTRRWEPEGAEFNSANPKAYRNDEIFVEATMASGEAEHEIVIRTQGNKNRQHRDMIGDGMYAHRSGDWKRDYQIEIWPVARETSMSHAFANQRRPVREGHPNRVAK